MCPIDCCSGVVVHLFLSSPQDLPEGSHASVGTLGGGVDPKWSKVTIYLCIAIILSSSVLFETFLA